jgi:pimeloyl-ACP methyl ester carboxylesterase
VVPAPKNIRGWTSRRAFAAAALGGALLAASGAGADIIKKEDMLRGIATTREQCAATAHTVWVKVYGQDYCVRYYVSNAGGEGSRPVVFLTGDYFWRINVNTWQWIPPGKGSSVSFEGTDRDINTDDLVKTADAFSKLTKTTAIYLARIGVDGTSGNHLSRKTLLELHLMNAALDAIRERHGFEGFHLAGQSGGSKLVAGLAGLRRDIDCAVAGSGPLAAGQRTNSKDPGRNLFDPMEFIPAIVKNRARLVVVTDRADRNVPVRQQTEFVEKLRRAGRNVPQHFVTAIDDNHHGVLAYTQLAAAGCVLGKPESEIAAALATLIRRSAAYNDQRRKEIAIFGRTGTAQNGITRAPAGARARNDGGRV